MIHKNRHMKHAFCLIGKPGSGKGTYGKLLADRMKYQLIVVGDVLRALVESGNELGGEINEYQQQGKLVNDELVAHALLSHLDGVKKTLLDDESRFRFILDGFPRTKVQAEIMDNKCDSVYWPEEFRLSFAIDISVPDKICMDKILGRRQCSICHKSFNISDVNYPPFRMPPQLPNPYPCDDCDMDTAWKRRLDDTEEILKNRLYEFQEKSKPVSDYFEESGRLFRFVPYNGIDDIHLLEALVMDQL